MLCYDKKVARQENVNLVYTWYAIIFETIFAFKFTILLQYSRIFRFLAVVFLRDYYFYFKWKIYSLTGSPLNQAVQSLHTISSIKLSHCVHDPIIIVRDTCLAELQFMMILIREFVTCKHGQTKFNSFS